MLTLPPATTNAFSPMSKLPSPPALLPCGTNVVVPPSLLSVNTIFMLSLSLLMGLVSLISSSPWTITYGVLRVDLWLGGTYSLPRTFNPPMVCSPGVCI